jgi:hypothetical protein
MALDYLSYLSAFPGFGVPASAWGTPQAPKPQQSTLVDPVRPAQPEHNRNRFMSGLVSILGGNRGYANVDGASEDRAARDALMMMGAALAAGGRTGKYGEAVSQGLLGGRQVYDQQLQQRDAYARELAKEALQNRQTEATIATIQGQERRAGEDQDWEREKHDHMVRAATELVGTAESWMPKSKRDYMELLPPEQRVAFFMSELDNAPDAIKQQAEKAIALGQVTQREQLDQQQDNADRNFSLAQQQHNLQKERYAKDDERTLRYDRAEAHRILAHDYGVYEDKRKTEERRLEEEVKSPQWQVDHLTDSMSPADYKRMRMSEWEKKNREPVLDDYLPGRSADLDEPPAPTVTDSQREQRGAVGSRLRRHGRLSSLASHFQFPSNQ